MFPTLTALPSPEPPANDSDDYTRWVKECEQWGSLRCQCGRGYFCREHGDWISGEEVGSGLAVAGDQQQPGSCPSYHYGGDYPNRENYVGQRDGSQGGDI
ncbi:hypothetical protein CEP52_017075 [Fusarium oligoseptatum]|uniref:Uncharacterized protein n=1 Tax=Fusarium oligoseptatum TaxID=2604345 RepID=A0A428RWY2_9HYPO|nr:hypothetical protein CEP52_017075 [Fusarium oligoseptatum]